MNDPFDKDHDNDLQYVNSDSDVNEVLQSRPEASNPSTPEAIQKYSGPNAPYYTLKADFPPVDCFLSLEEKVEISLLDPSCLQEWTRKRIAEYIKHIHSLKSVHNSAALIHRTLPAEIIMEVFRYLEPTDAQMAFRIIKVCRLWRSLLLRTSAFWAQLVASPRKMWFYKERDRARLELYLYLSRTCPLTLHQDGLDLPIARLLNGHSHRIVSLQLTIPCTHEGVQSLSTLLSGGMPHLQCLSVSQDLDYYEDGPPTALPISLSGQLFPRLRSIDTPQVLLDISDDLYGQLEEFKLTSNQFFIRPAGPYTDDDILELLSKCTALTSLAIERSRRARHDTRAHPPATGHHVVYLPRLRRLEIDSGHPTAALLSRLVLPATCLVQLQFDVDVAHSFRADLPADLASFPPMSTADAVEFDHNPRNVGDWPISLVTSRAGSRLLHLSTYDERDGSGPGGSCVALVTELAGMLAPLRDIKALTVRFRSPFDSTDKSKRATAALRILLESVPQLSRLQLAGPSEGWHPRAVLCDVDKSGEHCVCPVLEELEIDFTLYRTKVDVDSVSKRYSTRKVYTPRSLPSEHLRTSCKTIAEVIEHRASRGCALKALTFRVLHQSYYNWHRPAEPWDDAIRAEETRLRDRLRGIVEEVSIQIQHPGD